MIPHPPNLNKSKPCARTGVTSGAVDRLLVSNEPSVFSFHFHPRWIRQSRNQNAPRLHLGFNRSLSRQAGVIRLNEPPWRQPRLLHLTVAIAKTAKQSSAESFLQTCLAMSDK